MIQFRFVTKRAAEQLVGIEQSMHLLTPDSGVEAQAYAGGSAQMISLPHRLLVSLM
ncbi:hypothetical protein Dsin_005576 [Dipteronia sinensis]|uniref:Uncharacterized protein n=1 Tax=Dipteronia sinensis TaxID=43782 RepID=A0AAE0EF18_9ROSI|nr:hypothetical protein Dsin_005576 [Dipteronia sinensis]